MELMINILQVIIGLGLINVWIFRNSKATSYRGGSAKNLKDEFNAYGLPDAIYYVVGFLKLSSAIALLAAFKYPALCLPAAAVVVFLMIGALVMHLKVKDPLTKPIPALALLCMSSAIVVVHLFV